MTPATRQWLKTLAFVRKFIFVALHRVRTKKMRELLVQGHHIDERNTIDGVRHGFILIHKHPECPPGVAAATLIHEFGHFLLRKQEHKENDAWDAGRQGIPESLIPSEFDAQKKRCLEAYRLWGLHAGVRE
jgi:hypothetical protein